MKPIILLIGRNGQVGSELARTLLQVGTVVALNRDQLDLSNPGKIREVVRSVRPHLIVNAAAYTSVDKAESEVAVARAINSEAPAVLAEAAQRIGATLIHYSTDYVFDGSKSTPYTEGDPPNPKNVYGNTKLAGEEAIRLSGVPHLMFRTEWVYAQMGRNFLLTILRLATEREELQIVNDQIGAPTLSHEIAVATTQVLSRILKEREPGAFESASGTYHMTASGETTWFHFAKAILDEASRLTAKPEWFTAATRGKPIIAKRVTPILTSDYPTPAKRPSNSILSNDKLARTFGMRLPDWREQLKSVFA
jgi:dTDP-4-dehydrorhamnose reductase